MYRLKLTSILLLVFYCINTNAQPVLCPTGEPGSVLTVGILANRPPLVVNRNGFAAGFDALLLCALQESLQVQFKINEYFFLSIY